MSTNKEPSKKQPVKWYYSKAKQLLLKDLIDGVVTDDMYPKDVWKMRDEYQAYPLKRFGVNYRGLQDTVNELKATAAADEEAFQHDVALRGPVDMDGRWDGSLAQARLKQAVAEGRHLTMTKEDLYKSDDAFKEFSYQRFRPRLDNEVTKRKGRCYWLAKGSKKFEK